jgi:class 3 adenylate cyclase
MTCEEILDHAMAMLQRRGRVTYRTLKRQFQLDDDALEDLKAELIKAQRLAMDEDGEVLVWTGGAASPVARAGQPAHAPRAYTPAHLAEKILLSRSTLERERKQVTVLFADLKGSMELLADRDPEEARQLLDPVLERMIEAVHRYEGTVNQVMGDGIIALFGAPIAHEDHAVRACYAAQHEPPEREQAEAHYRQAFTLADELGMRPLVAHGHHRRCTLYAMTDQREQARAELAAAIDLYRATAMTFWLPQAEAALAEVVEVKLPRRSRMKRM